jgi:hypothetical protein
MNLNKNAITIALALTSSIISHELIAQQAEVPQNYGINSQDYSLQNYYIHLEATNRIEKSILNNKALLNARLSEIRQQQKIVINELNAIDSNIKVMGQSHLLGNFIQVKMSANYLDRVNNIEGVIKLVKGPANGAPSSYKAKLPHKKEIAGLSNDVSGNKAQLPHKKVIAGLSNYVSGNKAQLPHKKVIAGLSNDVSGNKAQLPHKKVIVDSSNDVSSNRAELPHKIKSMVNNTKANTFEAGAGIKVAIIGTGVDYTHQSLGGEGTLEAYEYAIENASNAHVGFPTGTVVEGFDLVSEQGLGMDPNPIDFAIEHESYNTGQGTRIASVIHELAPGVTFSAYKTSAIYHNDLGELMIKGETSESFITAMELAIDPNQDGSFTDRADIIVLDTADGFSYYNASASDKDSMALFTDMVEYASAAGSLVVVDSGPGGNWSDDHFNISQSGAAPSALTVSGMYTNDDGMNQVTNSAPYGPVRGSTNYSKPDLVSHANNITVAKVGSQNQSTTYSDNVLGAAKVAASAAILKSARPELSMFEVKALLMNTANNAVLDRQGKAAEVTLIGNGVENIDDALTSAVVAWEKTSNQPSLVFGFIERNQEQSFSKQLVVKNLTDSVQTYQLDLTSFEKENNSAISWDYPQSITLANDEVKVVEITAHIDFDKLTHWPIHTNKDISHTNWQKIELNGHINLTADDQPSIRLPWLIKPRKLAEIARDFASLTELYDGPAVEHAIQILDVERGSGLSMDFKNNSQNTMSYAVYPALYHKTGLKEGREGSAGAQFEAIGAGIYTEQSCPSGNKLAVAVRFQQPLDTSMANYWDKIGDRAFQFKLFDQEFMKEIGMDEVITSDPTNFIYDQKAQSPIYGFIEMNEEAKPTVYFIDYNKEFDEKNPRARFTESSLPAYVGGHGQNMVAQYCTNDLFVGEYQTTESFDKNFSWLFSTNRDVAPELYDESTLILNPYKLSEVEVTKRFDWDSGEIIEEYKPINQIPFFSKDPNQVDALFSEIITLESNETANLSTVTTCGGDGANGGTCNNEGMLLLSLNDNWGMWSPAGYDFAYSSVAKVKSDQVFKIDEDANIDHVIGQLKLDSLSFFAEGVDENSSNSLEFYQVNSVPSSPFQVSKTGEITVVNPDALDYEGVYQSYTLQVETKRASNDSNTGAVDVIINVNNTNDIAPVLINELADISIAVDTDILITLAENFTEVEGDVLLYSALNLPKGIILDETTGIIRGIASDAGDYKIAISASDGKHQTETEFMLSVVKDEESSGGSFGGGLLALLSLIGFTGRKKLKAKS